MPTKAQRKLLKAEKATVADIMRNKGKPSLKSRHALAYDMDQLCREQQNYAFVPEQAAKAAETAKNKALAQGSTSVLPSLFSIGSAETVGPPTKVRNLSHLGEVNRSRKEVAANVFMRSIDLAQRLKKGDQSVQ